MNIGRLTTACLLAVIVLVSVFLVRPLFEVRNGYAGKSIDYKVITLHEPNNESELKRSWEEILKQYGKDGWELVGFAPSNHPYIAKR